MRRSARTRSMLLSDAGAVPGKEAWAQHGELEPECFCAHPVLALRAGDRPFGRLRCAGTVHTPIEPRPRRAERAVACAAYGGIGGGVSMKKLINAPDRVVDEALAGMAAAHADLIRVEEPNIIVRKDAPKQGKVGVISGGGSGHEPMHGGFVGMGMLDAACPGAVFTSPVPDQMQAATKAVNGGAGVLHIVKNYTGDIMNFDLAAQLTETEGIKVKSIVIADDVAVKDSLYTAGRRGVGGTVLAEKIVGAAAEAGADLDKVTALCQKVQDNVRSMGMALTSCTVPAAGKPTFELGEDEMEIGIGIHG